MPQLHITLYTANTCQYCHDVRQYLAENSLDFQEISTDQDPQAANTVRQLTGQLLVPVTVVSADDRSDIVVVGYDIQKLNMALQDALNPKS